MRRINEQALEKKIAAFREMVATLPNGDITNMFCPQVLWTVRRQLADWVKTETAARSPDQLYADLALLDSVEEEGCARGILAFEKRARKRKTALSASRWHLTTPS
jgi:hypothetical protein